GRTVGGIAARISRALPLLGQSRRSLLRSRSHRRRGTAPRRGADAVSERSVGPLFLCDGGAPPKGLAGVSQSRGEASGRFSRCSPWLGRSRRCSLCPRPQAGSKSLACGDGAAVSRRILAEFLGRLGGCSKRRCRRRGRGLVATVGPLARPGFRGRHPRRSPNG